MCSQYDREYGDRGGGELSKSRSKQPAVEVSNLTKRYGDGENSVEAVSGVTFSIEQGSIVGILGPNGAGKTTCIKSLLSLVVPTEGTTKVAGVDVQRDTSTAFQRIGAVLEGTRNIYWRLTVRENMRFFSAIAGRNPDTMDQRHEELLTKFNLKDKEDTVVRELSRGQKQKVSIVCTLARNAEVVFLDEPTLGLDVESSIELRKELRNLADEEGITVVLTSHDMDVIESVCDRVIIMNSGQIIADRPVAELLSVFTTQKYKITTKAPLATELYEQLVDQYGLSKQTEANSNVYTIQVTGESFYDVVNLLQEYNVRIQSFDAVEVALEDVFLHLTGDGMDETDTGQRLLTEEIAHE
ncbi:ABC transporter ATP-binding protein (plasmid) [Haloferax mediterranei ATCC 33500]|uniref:ABC transporter n=2 Tax=Haloferax mediterranei (strain ATCC 33500 / DSM 1411 / JCM 8866 / NBRC 14739 / NCIMB 2177 / R-4) TaxID=523841 RepID=I3R9P3_HALMT|nr:ABC transporter ATP-binding protein [Haloferax mediterranei]AFK20953.1 ABC transporter ATP-binding protein [Haloferax mediterranei ATCC 33500]AHZ24179.1 ABC transporter [Haloferax mediterranei ATCC 33500]MDX5989939.1 ABC transporter ATP-binding protein [Haloferax mediterranei ATCC 33500]QCQ77128.1 ABC transporter ATP-binding protein [Haloferax mediterranei ATCC 33500]